jgi:hypothetical protein
MIIKHIDFILYVALHTKRYKYKPVFFLSSNSISSFPCWNVTLCDLSQIFFLLDVDPNTDAEMQKTAILGKSLFL